MGWGTGAAIHPRGEGWGLSVAPAPPRPVDILIWDASPLTIGRNNDRRKSLSFRGKDTMKHYEVFEMITLFSHKP